MCKIQPLQPPLPIRPYDKAVYNDELETYYIPKRPEAPDRALSPPKKLHCILE